MKVAISGVSSRLASGLVPLLESDESISEILGIDVKEPDYNYSKLRFIKKDVRDKSLIEDLKDYDAVIHLAFVVDPPLPKDTYSINIEGSQNFFDCAIKAGVKKIIYTSSIAAYGAFSDNPVPIMESHPVRLMKYHYFYNETKYIVEKHVDELEKQNPDVIITRFRPCIILLGKGTLPITINNWLVNHALDVKMQFIWIDDLVKAFYLALKKDAHGAFNMAGDNPLSWREIAEKTGMKSLKLPYRFTLFLTIITHKLKLQKVLLPGLLRISRYSIAVDTSKAKLQLGWKPEYDTLGAVKKHNQEFQNSK
jgi:UDP-glucose 4-epimerase